MITLRWWLLVLTIPVLLALGGIAGYMMQPASPPPTPTRPQPAAMDPSTAGGTPNAGRDPAVEAGAAFMARVTEYKQRLETNPTDLEALIFLGNANYDITRFDKASEYYARALVVAPSNIRVRTDLATAYHNMGQVDKAISEIQTVLKQEPSHETALFNLGMILLNDKKDKKGAIQAWERLLSEHPDSPRAQALRQKVEELKIQG